MTMWHPPEIRAEWEQGPFSWRQLCLADGAVSSGLRLFFHAYGSISPSLKKRTPSERAHVLSMGLKSLQTWAGMYQRGRNVCKQPAEVVVNVILLTEIAETYGPRQEKGLIPGRETVPWGPIAMGLWQDVVRRWGTWQPQPTEHPRPGQIPSSAITEHRTVCLIHMWVTGVHSFNTFSQCQCGAAFVGRYFTVDKMTLIITHLYYKSKYYK